MQPASSPYYADIFGNLFPVDMNGGPVVTNQGDQYFPDGSISSAASLYLPNVPWWVYAGGAVVLVLVWKGLR